LNARYCIQICHGRLIDCSWQFRYNCSVNFQSTIQEYLNGKCSFTSPIFFTFGIWSIIVDHSTINSTFAIIVRGIIKFYMLDSCFSRAVRHNIIYKRYRLSHDQLWKCRRKVSIFVNTCYTKCSVSTRMECIGRNELMTC